MVWRDGRIERGVMDDDYGWIFYDTPVENWDSGVGNCNII